MAEGGFWTRAKKLFRSHTEKDVGADPEELRRSDEPVFGGKSANLGELGSAGLEVPPGFAVAASAFRARSLGQKSGQNV